MGTIADLDSERFALLRVSMVSDGTRHQTSCIPLVEADWGYYRRKQLRRPRSSVPSIDPFPRVDLQSGIGIASRCLLRL